VPCYGDLVAAVEGRSGEFHGALTETFAQLISDIFVGRLGTGGLPADLVIRGVIPSVSTAATRATLHLELDGSLTAPR
jgi:hypothetical protein